MCVPFRYTRYCVCSFSAVFITFYAGKNYGFKIAEITFFRNAVLKIFNCMLYLCYINIYNNTDYIYYRITDNSNILHGA